MDAKYGFNAIVSTFVLSICGSPHNLALATQPQLPCGDGAVIFCDYFSTSDNSNWTFYNRQGGISEGRLWINGRYMPNSNPRDGWALTHIGDKSWKDYSYEVFFSNENLAGFPDNHHETTIYFRVAAQAENARQQTMYRLDIWNPGDVQEGGTCANWNLGAVGLAKYINGVIYDLAEACHSNTTVGRLNLPTPSKR